MHNYVIVRLFPQLKKQYAGQYVAIYQGQLIDHDTDYGVLFERIDENYPDVFVWLTQVEDEPIGTITLRSPLFLNRLMGDAAAPMLIFPTVVH